MTVSCGGSFCKPHAAARCCEPDLRLRRYARLETITSGAQTVTYAYDATRGLLNTTAFTGGTTLGEKLRRTRQAASNQHFNSRRHRTELQLHLQQSLPAHACDQRRTARTGHTRTTTGANSSVARRPGRTTRQVWGAQTEYAFDSIGNRQVAKAGGNHAVRRGSQLTRQLAQSIRAAQRAGAVDVTGTANAGQRVSLMIRLPRAGRLILQRVFDGGQQRVGSEVQVKVVGARQTYGRVARMRDSSSA
jgi:hypothetical protein